MRKAVFPLRQPSGWLCPGGGTGHAEWYSGGHSHTELSSSCENYAMRKLDQMISKGYLSCTMLTYIRESNKDSVKTLTFNVAFLLRQTGKDDSLRRVGLIQG